ncbi:MAG: hypothetical protein ACI9GW_002329, partial [Halieaceae bacterium]
MSSFRSVFLGLVVVLSAGCQQQSTPEPAIAPVVEPVAAMEMTEFDLNLADAPYAVGSSTFFIHDESRPYDSVAGINTGVRTLVTELWYPVA